MVGTTADFRHPGSRYALPLNHLLGENRETAGRIGEVRLATIGRKAAVADFGRLQLSGALAWWVWGVVHVLFLSGMRNRAVVALEWFWAYLTYRPSTRLITGEIPIQTRSTVASSTEDFPSQRMIGTSL